MLLILSSKTEAKYPQIAINEGLEDCLLKDLQWILPLKPKAFQPLVVDSEII